MRFTEINVFGVYVAPMAVEFVGKDAAQDQGSPKSEGGRLVRVLFAVFCSGADGSCARLRFRAAIKSITGDGVDTARGFQPPVQCCLIGDVLWSCAGSTRKAPRWDGVNGPRWRPARNAAATPYSEEVAVGYPITDRTSL